MATSTIEKYQALVGQNLLFIGNDQVIPAMQEADVMVCDNSSILQEFLLLKKPVVTFRNIAPRNCMLDFENPEQLQESIEQALDTSPEMQQSIEAYGPSVTPYLDGDSAHRVLEAVNAMLESNWKDKKPSNYWRNWKMRRQLGYFRLHRST